MIAADLALLVATALHLGFQLTVTAVVYPALAQVPAELWPAAHRAHTRRITPLVVLVYGSLAVSGSWALLAHVQAWTVMALVATTVAALTTAAVAAPAHRHLAGGPDPAAIARLLHADRFRTIAAATAVPAATLAAAA